MVNGKRGGGFTAILASIIIPAKDFAFRKANLWSGRMNHVLQADDRGNWVGGRSCMQDAPAVHDQGRFFSQHQTNCAL